MKIWIAILISFVALTSTAFGQVAAKPTTQHKSAGFDPKRDAAKDIDNAIVLATKQNKRILLDVGGEW